MFTSDNQASIATNAFNECTKLSDIYLPVDATALPNSYNSNAFNNCPNIGII
jgi:hypothetical protein